jgi:hypothetical protein
MDAGGRATQKTKPSGYGRDLCGGSTTLESAYALDQSTISRFWAEFEGILWRFKTSV